MRFEVNVDDGANLDLLHKAREAFNAAHADLAAPDMPTFVQRLMDQVVAAALLGLGGPTTLSAALSKIADLQAKNAELKQEITASAVPVSVAPDKPA